MKKRARAPRPAVEVTPQSVIIRDCLILTLTHKDIEHVKKFLAKLLEKRP